MAGQDYWAEAPMQRQQMVLFAPSLDAMIGADDPVRLVDEVLARLDWSAWEAEYDTFRQLCRVAMHLGLVRLGEVAFDGTRVKVRTEWLWAAMSFNIMKIVRNVARLRAEFAALAAATEV